MRSSVLLVCLGVLAVAPATASAQMCAVPWSGIMKMKGTLSVNATGMSSSSSGSFSLAEQVNASPDMPVVPPPEPGAPPTWEWTGMLNAGVNYNLTLTDPAGDVSTTTGGPSQAGAGGPAMARLGIDPINCTYSLILDQFFIATITDSSGTSTQVEEGWGPPGGLNASNLPLPTTGTALTGSMSYTDTTTYPGTPILWTISWTIDGNSDCMVNLPQLWAQADPAWGHDYYDHSQQASPTIANWGCAMTALDMGMIQAGWTGYGGQGGTTPGDFNTLMVDHDDFLAGGGVSYVAATRDLSQGALKFDDTHGWRSSTNNLALAYTAIDAAICDPDPHPMIVGVKLGPEVINKKTHQVAVIPHHFVLVIAKTNSKYMIADPAGGVIRSLDYYGGDFETRGFAKDPPGDLSGLAPGTADNATIVVSDPTGLESGVDGGGNVMQMIPRSAAGADAITGDDDATTDTTPVNFSVDMFQPAVGDYKVDVQGLGDGPFELDVHGYTQSGAGQPFVKITGTAQEGVTATYYVHYDSADGSTTTVDQTPGGGGGDMTMGSHGGCGCRAGGDASSTAGSWVLVAGVVLVVRRRRRK